MNFSQYLGHCKNIYSSWYSKGIVYILDLLEVKEQRFLWFNEFLGKFDVNCSFIQYLGIIDAIPRAWRQTIATGPIANEDLEMFAHNIHQFKNKTHKTIYSELVSKVCDIPEDKFYAWVTEFRINNKCIDEIDWVEPYSPSKHSTCWTRIRHVYLR